MTPGMCDPRTQLKMGPRLMVLRHFTEWGWSDCLALEEGVLFFWQNWGKRSCFGFLVNCKLVFKTNSWSWCYYWVLMDIWVWLCLSPKLWYSTLLLLGVGGAVHLLQKILPIPFLSNASFRVIVDTLSILSLEKGDFLVYFTEIEQKVSRQ